ncbi:YSC84-related protein [Dyella japonica]|uniref:Twin-arginine translocation pathway signal protein n=1 Tax=Dyella japonica A8 TaxID=1217721 RepID=A0A075JYM9_9GAMM|nr:YSC84-related protein [Dyella japonica]AIF46700.1 twin-arginine translocation pathway signal protein [Dyella japonica A8]
MFKPMRSAAVTSLLIAAIACSASAMLLFPGRVHATAASDSNDPTLERDSFAALNALYASEPKAKQIGAKSRAILVFPGIVKAGLMVGGLEGNGVLIEQGKVTAKYNISAASFGLQAGAQKFSQVMFLANDQSLAYLNKSSGWSVGVGPSVVVVDSGTAKSMTTDNLNSDVYVFIFGQKGLMGGLGVQGQKITRTSH